MPTLDLRRLGAAASRLALAAALAGCATQRYVALDVTPATRQAAWLDATTDDPALRAALAEQGVAVSTWPLPHWDLPALSALALLRHPDLAVARAELHEAQAAAEAARQRAGADLQVGIEHHSAEGSSDSPWSLGLAIDLAYRGEDRRRAVLDGAAALQQQAVQQAAESAWQVTQRVRVALHELLYAERRLALAEAGEQLQQQRLAALRSRLAQGAVAATELRPAEQAQADAARLTAQSRAARGQAQRLLAVAVGLPLERLLALPLRLPAPADGEADDKADDASAALAPLALQRNALLNRIDLRAALARYAAADAALRLELSRQWPELVFKPGYAWDQGDTIWSLGLGLAIPPGGRNQAAIAQAQARRAAEAARCLALQAQALHALDAARQSLHDARLAHGLARRQADAAQALLAQAERRLAAGEADRLDIDDARLAVLEARRGLLDTEAARAAAWHALQDAVQRPLDQP